MGKSTNLLLIFYLFAVSYAAKDLLGTDTSEKLPKSNMWTMKYEGTLEEAKQFGASIGLEFKRKVFGNWYVFSNPSSNHLGLKDVPDIHINLIKAQKLDGKVKYIQQENYRKRVKRSLTIDDEAWPKQWNFEPLQTPNMRVYQAWEMGYTGSGITVAVLDDGIDVEHPDLIRNYDSSLAYDFVTDSTDASHKLPLEGHGTNCAGLVAAANDTNCIIGIAFESTFTGIRLLGTEEEDTFLIASMEASALTHKNEDIDIYSNSWGPPDDGIDMSSLEPILNEAFEYGIKNGRNGKGAIYTFASGNGGPVDSCNADPYSSSMYTISVAALNQIGNHTYYSEPCTSILTAAFSGGGLNFPNITTTGANETCIDNFDGTSAACPQVTGIIALTLQANPELTWRDIQHMIVELSDHSGLPHSSDSYEFYTNGAGKTVSMWSGFGLIDAKAMVENAPTWPAAPPRISCGSGDLFVDRYEADAADMTETFNVSNCLIGYLEHVHVNLYYKSSYRGDVEVYLKSPMGTVSKILPARPYDNVTDSTYSSFMSVHTWGEDPNGEWELTVFPVYAEIEVHFVKWSLHLYGTATYPLDGIPAAGAFGSPCNSSASCGTVVDGGCLKDPKALCDNMCISCSDGYHRNGNLCEKDCPPLYAIDKGYVVLTYTQEGIIAKYSCYKNYAFTRDGDIIRECGSDGVWTGTVPVCDTDCGSPDAPVNGRYTVSGTTVGYSAIYSCNNGFVHSGGDKIRNCSEDGEWTGRVPICRKDLDCGPLVAPVNGRVSVSGTAVDFDATYSCNDGFVLSGGNIIRICSESGEWTGDMPICRKGCKTPESPRNGNVSFVDTFESSVATYTCKEGYNLSGGDARRVCGSDGNWTSTTPVCLSDCGTLDAPDNGILFLNSTKEGSTTTYSCLDGFNITSGTSSRTCGSDGNWSGTKPVCSDKVSVGRTVHMDAMGKLVIGMLALVLVYL